LTGGEAVFVAAAVFWGAAARGFTGFGAVLFTLPVLVVALPVRTAVPLLVAIGMVNGLWLTWRVRREADAAECRRLLAAGIPGALVGLLLFRQAPDRLLQGLLGLVIAGVGGWLLVRQRRESSPWQAAWGYGAGLCGGVLGGLYGLSGPAPVAYLSGRDLPPTVFRATLLLYITALDILLAAGFALVGAMPTPAWPLALGLLPVALLGSWLGEQLQRRVSPHLFQTVSSLALMLMGVALALRTWLSAAQ